MEISNQNKAYRHPGITPGWLVTFIILFVIVCDQILKIWVKTNFYLGESVELTSWWQLKFIENNGMAFGIELWSKLALTIGRIGAVIFFIWMLWRIKGVKKLRIGFFIAAALITAGAAGNIFDCVFYGKLFNNPLPPEVATFLPSGGGYASWFEGRVVDMLYFPIFEIEWPTWVPILGGKTFEFFQYIFNIADAAICVGVALLVCFYNKDAALAFNSLEKKKTDSIHEL